MCIVITLISTRLLGSDSMLEQALSQLSHETADLHEGALSHLKLRSRLYIALKGKGDWIVGKGDLG